MKKARYVLTALCFALPGIAGIKAQSNTVSTVTLSAVSFFIDTVNTPEKAQQVIHTIQRHPEVKDFDLKGRSCNFTLDNSAHILDVITGDLKVSGFRIENLILRENETYTHVPVILNGPKQEITEEEARRLHEKGMLPKE